MRFARGFIIAVLFAALPRSTAAGEPYAGWSPLYWARWSSGETVLWDPWPFAAEVRTLAEGETFDFPPTRDPADAFLDRNGYIEIVTRDGEMGWIPATAGVTLSCVSR